MHYYLLKKNGVISGWNISKKPLSSKNLTEVDKDTFEKELQSIGVKVNTETDQQATMEERVGDIECMMADMIGGVV